MKIQQSEKPRGINKEKSLSRILSCISGGGTVKNKNKENKTYVIAATLK